MPKFVIERAIGGIGDASPEELQHVDEGVSRSVALKARLAGVVTTSVVVSLVLAPEALAKLSANHNETVLALD